MQLEIIVLLPSYMLLIRSAALLSSAQTTTSSLKSDHWMIQVKRTLCCWRAIHKDSHSTVHHARQAQGFISTNGRHRAKPGHLGRMRDRNFLTLLHSQNCFSVSQNSWSKSHAEANANGRRRQGKVIRELKQTVKQLRVLGNRRRMKNPNLP